jgi:hypothetical protein
MYRTSSPRLPAGGRAVPGTTTYRPPADSGTRTTGGCPTSSDGDADPAADALLEAEADVAADEEPTEPPGRAAA